MESLNDHDRNEEEEGNRARRGLCFDKKASGFRAFRGLGTYGSFSLWPVMRDLCRLLSVSARMSRKFL